MVLNKGNWLKCVYYESYNNMNTYQNHSFSLVYTHYDFAGYPWDLELNLCLLFVIIVKSIKYYNEVHI